MKPPLNKRKKIVLAKYWLYTIEDICGKELKDSNKYWKPYIELKDFLRDQGKFVKNPLLQQKIALQFAIPQKYYNINYRELRDNKFPNLFKTIVLKRKHYNENRNESFTHTTIENYSKEKVKIFRSLENSTLKIFNDIPKPKAFAEYYIRVKEHIDKHYQYDDNNLYSKIDHGPDSEDWLLGIFIDMKNFLIDAAPTPLLEHIETLLEQINQEKLNLVNTKEKQKLHVKYDYIEKVSTVEAELKNTDDSMKKNESIHTNELGKSKLDTDSAERSKEFKLIWEGATWAITFNNETKRVDNTIGMHIIAHLIKNQGDIIRADEIYHDKVANISYKDLRSEMYEAQLQEQENISVESGEKEAIKNVTQKAIREIYKTQKKWKQDLQQAEIERDRSKINELTSKIIMVESWLRQNTDKYGKPRKIPDRLEKARKAIIASVNTARKNIEKIHPEFYEHLKKYLIIRQESYYRPKPPIRWIVK